MELKHLRAFCLTAELGSVSAAARKLGKGQPLVSQWLADLETDLNLSLFERSGNRCQLSEAGSQLLPQARQLVQQASLLRGSAEQLSQGEPLYLNIGFDEWLPSQPVSQVISAFLQQHPQVSVNISRHPRPELLRATTQGKLHLALASEYETHHTNLRYRRLGYYQDCLVAGSAFPLSNKSHVTADQLAQYHELVLGNETEETDEEGYSTHIAFISDLPMLLELLVAGTGFAVLPRESIEPFLSAGTLVELHTDFEQAAIIRRVEMLWRPELEQSHTFNHLLQLIQQQHRFHQN